MPVDVKTNLTEPYCILITLPLLPPPLAKDGLAVGWQEEMGLSGKLPNAHIDTQRLLRTDDITALSHTG